MSDAEDLLYAMMLDKQLNGESNLNNSNAEVDPQSDYELAVKIQALMDAENEPVQETARDSDLDTSLQFVYPSNNPKSSTMNNNKTVIKAAAAKKQQPKTAIQASHDDFLNQTVNLVHPQWELVDPTPDIYSMFLRFDEKFFQQRLGAVALEWSKRMYSCAGICYQRGSAYFKEVTIRLSEPLLKLRPRKDLVETLLHEMIHAYCFVLNIREGNGGHGPNFKRIMETINKVAGTNITVYHSFHDEVAAYRTHIWRCTGICQNRTPFQGYVKRTSNRAPGPNDQWWAKHQRECGGTFMKVGEPQTAKIKAPKPVKPPPKPSQDQQDLYEWLNKKPIPPADKKAAIDTALLGNLVSAVPPTSYPGLSSKPFVRPEKPAAAKKRGSNVVGFADLCSSDDDNEPAGGRQTPRANAEMNGPGYSLNGGNPNADVKINESDLRKIRLKRFGQTNTSQEPSKPEVVPARKRRRPSADDEIVTWESYDDDVWIQNTSVPTVNLDDDGSESEEVMVPGPKTRMSQQQRTMNIKREVMEEESSYTEDDILFIDDEYNDNEADNDISLTAATELADQSIIDDLFGEDTLLKEFQRENAAMPTCSNYSNCVDNDIVSCPICFEKMKRTQLANHFEGCSITVRVEPPSFSRKGTSKNPAKKPGGSKPSTSRGSKPQSRDSQQQFLRNAGYTDEEIAELNLNSSNDSVVAVESSEDELTPRQRRQRNLFKQTVGCPKCGQELMGHQLEAHRSVCTKNRR
ncbi:DNA-dependent metalloprotease SPRTN [Drosophila ficusphila]|uniref:DNA-dependent metalloprotease SPRTN n=1 Tax=Drosophila ficusphila TaxID=30025 RepID=UPI0007E72695|nr:DNA-dependent metalloprotease SPRTN [Drosophila ficusphila]